MLSNVQEGFNLGGDLGFYFLIATGATWLLILLGGLLLTALNFRSHHQR